MLAACTGKTLALGKAFLGKECQTQSRRRSMQGEQYAAEGSQPVATGTVVQQEPVVLSGTVVGMEPVQPQPGKVPVVSAGAPPPTMVVQQPPVVMVSGVVQPAAPAPAGRWLGGNACGCCDPPGGCPLCCTAFWCPCVVVGQLWHRIVERGGGGTVLGILAGVTVGAYVLEYITNAVLWWLYPLQIGWLWRLAMSFVYLFYMLKIREAAAREGGFQDHPVCFPRLVFFFCARCTPRRWRAPPAVTALRRRRVDALNTRRCSAGTSAARPTGACPASRAISCATTYPRSNPA